MKNKSIGIVIVAAISMMGAQGGAPKTPAFKIIVHPSNPATSMDRAEISNLFLKRTTTWSGGLTALPVDLLPGSYVRARFSSTIHGRDVSAVQAYWQRMVFSGRGVPPAELSAERAVEFVSANSGAIAYVPASTAHGRCKLLSIR